MSDEKADCLCKYLNKNTLYLTNIRYFTSLDKDK